MSNQSSEGVDGNRLLNKSREIDWSKHISDWKASGLSKAAFCRREQINLNLFYYWSLKIVKSTNSSAPKLLPVKIEKDILPTVQSLHLSLPSGVKIKFPLPVTTNELVKLIQGLCHATPD